MQLLSHQVFYITPLTVLFCVCFSVELFQSEAKKKKKGNKKQCIVLDTNLQCGRQTEEIKSVRHMIHVQINRSVCVQGERTNNRSLACSAQAIHTNPPPPVRQLNTGADPQHAQVGWFTPNPEAVPSLFIHVRRHSCCDGLYCLTFSGYNWLRCID